MRSCIAEADTLDGCFGSDETDPATLRADSFAMPADTISVSAASAVRSPARKFSRIARTAAICAPLSGASSGDTSGKDSTPAIAATSVDSPPVAEAVTLAACASAALTPTASPAAAAAAGVLGSEFVVSRIAVSGTPYLSASSLTYAASIAICSSRVKASVPSSAAISCSDFAPWRFSFMFAADSRPTSMLSFAGKRHSPEVARRSACTIVSPARRGGGAISPRAIASRITASLIGSRTLSVSTPC